MACSKNILTVTAIGSLVLGISLFAQGSGSAYSSAEIRDIETFLEKSKQDEMTLSQTKRILSVQYDSMVAEIIRLKEKQAVGFFDRIQLKNLLKDCEDISQQFMKLDPLLSAHLEADRAKTEELIVFMEDEIRSEIGEQQKNRQSPDYSTESLRAMLAEKAKYQKQLNDSLNIRMAAVKASKNDDYELLEQKGDFLMDQQDKLLRYIGEIDRAIRRIKADHEIQTRADRLLESGRNAEEIPRKVKSILALSRDRIWFSEDTPSVIDKLIEEKLAAGAIARRLETDARELYWLANYKANH